MAAISVARGLGWPETGEPAGPARERESRRLNLGWPDEVPPAPKSNPSGAAVSPAGPPVGDEPPVGPARQSNSSADVSPPISEPVATTVPPAAAATSPAAPSPAISEPAMADQPPDTQRSAWTPPAPRPIVAQESVVTLAEPAAPAVAADEPGPAGPGTVLTTPNGGPNDLDTPIAQEAAAALRAANYRRAPLPAPLAPRVMVVANQKGGVGKTTTAVNVAAALALRGLRVLVIDLDPQANASTAFAVDHRADTPSMYDVLVDDAPLQDVITRAEGLDQLSCAPATIDLAGAEIELVSVVARESRLRRALGAFLAEAGPADRPDYVFIDCPPSLGLLTVNGLVGADEVLVPIQCEYYALEGVGQLLKNIELVRAHLNPTLAVSTIVLTMYDARTRLAAQVADEVRRHFGDVVLQTIIPRSVRISEAPSYGQTVMTYDPGSTGALSYLEAAREIAEHGHSLARRRTKGNVA